jgi:nucleotide-binding universal stress UspA family protein
LGSTAHQVVQHSACSVLVCPRRRKPEGGE